MLRRFAQRSRHAFVRPRQLLPHARVRWLSTIPDHPDGTRGQPSESRPLSSVADVAPVVTSSSSSDSEVDDPGHAVISCFDMFSIGIGPSSSHTVGPMRAAQIFTGHLTPRTFEQAHSARVELYGSLACTGEGHGTPNAILMGLEGEVPDKVDPDSIIRRCDNIVRRKTLQLRGSKTVKFDPKVDMVFKKHEVLPLHSNGMRFWVFDEHADMLAFHEFYSIGGGFVVDGECLDDNAFYMMPPDVSSAADEGMLQDDNEVLKSPPEVTSVWDVVHEGLPDEFQDHPKHPQHEFTTTEELIMRCRAYDLDISQLVFENELTWRPEDMIREKTLDLWRAMDSSIEKGISTRGILPGRLKVVRRAPGLHKILSQTPDHSPLRCFSDSTRGDWLATWAIAVNEENACGGRVVTAPTNGAAGVIPAVIKYYLAFHNDPSDEGICRFLWTCAAIGMLFKRGASISAAEVGCQGEVGVAASMAAAGLAEVMGGTVDQVTNAAEIAMEHSLGLTCDPIDGLVQIPCIERNAMGAAKAVAAARLALCGDGKHRVSLDEVIETMRQTGLDMQAKYKETALGGLAVNVPVC